MAGSTVPSQDSLREMLCKECPIRKAFFQKSKADGCAYPFVQ